LTYWLQKLTARTLDSKMPKEEEQIQLNCQRPPKLGGEVTTICPDCHGKVSNALGEE